MDLNRLLQRDACDELTDLPDDLIIMGPMDTMIGSGYDDEFGTGYQRVNDLRLVWEASECRGVTDLPGGQIQSSSPATIRVGTLTSGNLER